MRSDTSSSANTGICVHNVSYRDTYDWIEKTNRYTASPDRALAPGYSPEPGLRAYIEERTAHWFGRTASHTLYVDAVSALRLVYDIVDVVKSLENTIGVHVDSDFAAITRSLSSELDAFLAASKAGSADVAIREPFPHATGVTGVTRVEEPTPPVSSVGSRLDRA